MFALVCKYVKRANKRSQRSIVNWIRRVEVNQQNRVTDSLLWTGNCFGSKDYTHIVHTSVHTIIIRGKLLATNYSFDRVNNINPNILSKNSVNNATKISATWM